MKPRATIFPIDSSWIERINAAVKWYDLVIKDFAGTPAARNAYEQKLLALLGWKATGQSIPALHPPLGGRHGYSGFGARRGDEPEPIEVKGKAA